MSLPSSSSRSLGLAQALLPLLVLPIAGTFGLMAVEGWGFLDAFYMAIITLTTVGYEEVHPLSTAGRWLVIIYLIFGLGIFLYSLTHIGEILLRAQLQNIVGKRRMESKVRHMKDHYIIGGFGRMGQALYEKLKERGDDLVVIERDPKRHKEMSAEGMHCILGDTTDDRFLLEAGVERARGLAVVLPHDADNLYVVMSSRLLNKDLQILSRASDEQNEAKMLKAGANRVVSPYKSGAARMAQLLANPTLNDFIEIFDAQGSEYDLAQIVVGRHSRWADRKLSESDFTSLGVMVVGIRKEEGKMVMPPHRDSEIEIDDVLLVLGQADAIQKVIDAN